MSDFWKLRNVFITGCSGFLGYWLTEYLLKEGANVIGLVRDVIPQSNFFRFKLNERVTVIRGMVEDYFLLERILNEYEIDTVFHLAAQTIVEMANRSSLSTFETNIKGTWNLIEACRRTHPLVKRIVIASSDKAYGTQERLPYTEDSPLKGSHPYDVSKSCADLIAYSFFNTYKLPISITRCGNFYGGGDLNFNRLVCGTIRSVLHNKPLIIRSDGTPKRDYIYIKDAVNGYITLAENLENLNLSGEAFNFSGGKQLSVLDMTDKILEIMGEKDYPIKILNKSRGEIKDQYLSIEKAKKVLNWAPHYSLEDGLKETIDWYHSFFGMK
ncbi:MAG: sugar dehydratase [Deltaproteobacteria bacterium DG_8]|nr:MAG: sugar dehydratase [Deltaproteobacteria bacterium DG_8]